VYRGRYNIRLLAKEDPDITWKYNDQINTKRRNLLPPSLLSELLHGKWWDARRNIQQIQCGVN
jgi:hypothetical protein